MAVATRTGTWAESLLTFIQQYPGVHLREIRRRLSIPIGTLDYHLYRLGKEGLIAVRFQGGYKCCFPTRWAAPLTPLGEQQETILALLRQTVPRSILLHLYLEGPTAPAVLAESVSTSGPNLSYFLKRLESAHTIVREDHGGGRVVRLVDPPQVHRLLLEYPPLPETSVDRFVRFWSELHP
jgi:predicted transcriptional regulator